MRAALLLLLVVVGCDQTPTAPDAITCAAAITPPTFLVLRDGRDTVELTNHYLMPHRTADTVLLAKTATAPATRVIVNHPGHCSTLLDSLFTYAPPLT
jgi:hypothetical protein